jgi:hypothetical protein
MGKRPAPGLVEYLGQWSRRSRIKVQDLVEEVPLDPKASGALYLLQAGRMDKAYLETLEALDWRELVELPPLSQQSGQNLLFHMSSPFDDLFAELTDYLKPDAILLDAPTGFNDTSNLYLRSLTDLVVAIFSPSKVQLDGIGRVVSLLTAEQNKRSRKRMEPTPDVYCVASTILLSRIAGSHVRRLGDAFAYLDDIRLDVLRRTGATDADIADIARQEPAIINYDERLADLESLPTEDEPRENHFAAFQDVISYVNGSLPPPRPRVVLDGDRKQALLADLEPSYGLYAEQEPELDSLFLRTQHIEELKDPRVVVILGGKGSGKTALFSFVTTESNTYAVHGPRIGLGPDLLCNIQDASPSMDVFWRLYMLSVLPDLSAVSDVEIRRLAAIISRLRDEPLQIEALVAGMRTKDLGVRVLNAWSELDRFFADGSRQVTLCLDGLDAAFKADTARRERGLVDLLTAWQASFSTLKCVGVKIFLRTDLWHNLSFPERSHFLGKEMRITWDRRNLWRLVVKRALHPNRFQRWCDESGTTPVMTEGSVEAAGQTDLFPYLDRLFQRHIWAGKNSLSRNWILRRLEDAKGAVYPRDLICLLKEAIRLERDRLNEHQQHTSEESVISRQSLSDALAPTSHQRVDAVREEYQELRPVLDTLRGLSTTGVIEILKERLDERQINVLSEAGVIRLTEGNYVVPDLYRHGLEMQRMGPR